MEDKTSCQSCGMPIGVGFYGTNADGSANDEFCKVCFENGQFREPNITLDDMIARTAANMVDVLEMDPEGSKNLASSLVPTLKRWKELGNKA